METKKSNKKSSENSRHWVEGTIGEMDGKQVRLHRSFIRKKQLHGNTYLYEITPYWDFEAGKQRQKSRYIGLDRSSPIHTKPIDEQQDIASCLPTSLQNCVDFGDAYLCQVLIEELQLPSILRRCFSEADTQLILLTAGYRLLCGKAFAWMKSWAETSEMSRYYPKTGSLSSPALSKKLDHLGEQLERGQLMNFFHHWTNQFSYKEENWLFDLTSFSSQANSIDSLERGYAKQLPRYPQLNMGLLVNQTRHLPMLYKLYPGSIKDVSTLLNLLQETKALSIPSMQMILDRGFYSAYNLSALLKAGVNFIVPLPRSCHSLWRKIQEEGDAPLSSAKHLFKMPDGEIHYGRQGQVDVQGQSLHYTLYLDINQQQKEYQAFLKELFEAEETLSLVDWTAITPLERRRDRWKEMAKQWDMYLSLQWDSDQKRYRIHRQLQKIEQAKDPMGLQAWLHTRPMLAEDCVYLYRQRDMVEKLFDACKNDLSGLPLRIHQNHTMQSLFFILFISLILQYHLLSKMKQGQVDPKYSVSGIFFEMHKLKKAIWSNGVRIISETTKTQRIILEQMNILLPTKEGGI